MHRIFGVGEGGWHLEKKRFNCLTNDKHEKRERERERERE
jgi:hypothetical protein